MQSALGHLGVDELVVSAVEIAMVDVVTIALYWRLAIALKKMKPERLLWLNLLMAVLMTVAFYWVLAIAFDWFPRSGDLFPWWLLSFPLIGMLVRTFFTHRAGTSMHCPKCEYEFQFGDAAEAPRRCPECGKEWLGHLKQGRRSRPPKWIVAGLMFMVGTTVVAMTPVSCMAFLSPYLPTPLLCASLYVAPLNTPPVWMELETRPLESWEIWTMAERVLAMRAKSQYNRGSIRWFESMAATGQISQNLLARFYGEGFAAEMIVPSHVKAGQMFPAVLRVTHVAYDSGSRLFLMFAGYTVGDSTTTVGRRPMAIAGSDLQPNYFLGSLRHRDALDQLLTVEQRGEVRVRVVYWLVYMPGSTISVNANWHEDGTPEKPIQAIWFERVELDKYVLVE